MADVARSLNGTMNEDRVSVTNCRGNCLSGVLHHPSSGPPRGAVILCHGMDSNKESDKLVFLGRALAQRGLLTLRFDFAYVGESSGRFEDITYNGEVEDLSAAYAFIRSRCDKKIGVLGSSMGGTVALLFAAREPTVAALVTIAAPFHPEAFPHRMLTPIQIQRWRDDGFTLHNGRRLNVSLLLDLETIDVAAAVKRITCPVLILHGETDEVVPVQEAYELRDSLPHAKRLLILKGADHRLSNPAAMELAVNEALDWLTDHVCSNTHGKN